MKKNHIAARVPLAAALCCASLAEAGVNQFTRTGTDGGFTTAIAVKPTAHDTLLAATSRGIYRSTDNGATWTLATGSEGYTGSILFDPVVTNRAFAAGTRLKRSDDSGATWNDVMVLPGNTGMLVGSGGRNYLSAMYGNLWHSVNSGLDWEPITVPWATGVPNLRAIAADPNNDEVLYACVAGEGLYKTEDHGDNWLPPPVNSPCEAGSGWSISVNPFDSDEVLAATTEGLYLSTNAGATWVMVTPAPVAEWAMFDPHVDGRVLAIDAAGTIMRSTDSGLTWLLGNNGAALKLYRPAGAAFGDADEVYLATPDGPMYSTDNGTTFELRVTGIEASEVTDIVAADDGTIYALQQRGIGGAWRRTANDWAPLDNAELLSHVSWFDFQGISVAASDSSVLYVSDESRGPIRSTNGGADWIAAPGSFGAQSFGVTVEPTNPLVAYAIPSGASNLKRTVDGGLNYTDCGLAVSLNVFRIDRADPNIIYGVGGSPPNNRIYKSTDACDTWDPISDGFALPTTDVAIHPEDHETVYVSGYSSLLLSTNGGADWAGIDFGADAGAPGTDFHVERVLLDPLRPSTLWVLTSGTRTGFGRSIDGGASWQWAVSPRGIGAAFESGVLDPVSPDTVVIGARYWGLIEYQVATDLQVSVVAATDPTPLDRNTPWTIKLANLGPWDSSAAIVTINLPAGATVPSPPPGCTSAALKLTCELTRIHVDEVRDLSVTFQLPESVGIAQVEVLVEGHESDPLTGNNSATANLDTRQTADLAIEVPEGLVVGDRSQETTLQVTAINKGSTTAPNARVVFNLHPVLEPVSATTPVGSCVTASQTVTCTLGNVASGVSHDLTLTFRGTVSGDGGIGVHYTADALDANSDQNASVGVLIYKYFDLSTQLEAAAGAKTAGTPFQVTATLRSDGDDLVSPLVQFTLTGATASSAVTNGGSCFINGATITCQTGDIGYGGTTTVLIAASAATAGTVTIAATAAHDGEGTDNDPSNNAASLSFQVSAASGGGGGGSSPPPKKGGGGSFDWLALGLLGLLARRHPGGAA